MASESIKHNLFRYAEDFIVKQLGVDNTILQEYIKSNRDINTLTLNEIFEHFLLHAKNKGMGGRAIENVFGTPEKENTEKSKRWTTFGKFLKNFNPHEVIREFPTVFELFPHLKDEQFKPLNGKKSDPDMFVYLYCLTILGTAQFLTKYQTSNDFYSWVTTKVEKDPESIFLELEQIPGIGSALSRDLIKELGFTGYVKPDVHTIAVTTGLGLLEAKKVKAVQVAHTLQEIAKSCGTTPYALDKLLWLIGSGNYFEHERHSEEQKLLAKKAYDTYRRNSKISDFVSYVQNRESGIEA